MDCAQTGTREHRDSRLGDHGHINDHAIAFSDAQAGQRSGKYGYLVAQFAISKGFNRVGDRAIVDQRGLIATALFNVQVEGVVTRVYLAAGEPAIKRRAAVVEYLFPPLVPVDCFRCLAPETDRIF